MKATDHGSNYMKFQQNYESNKYISGSQGLWERKDE